MKIFRFIKGFFRDVLIGVTIMRIKFMLKRNIKDKTYAKDTVIQIRVTCGTREIEATHTIDSFKAYTFLSTM